MSLNYLIIKVVIMIVEALEHLKMEMSIMECMQVMESHQIQINHSALKIREYMKSLISKNKSSMMDLLRFAISIRTLEENYFSHRT